MNQEQLWHRIHEDTIAVRNKELDVYWALNGFFSVILLGSLGFALTQLGAEQIFLQLVVCLFGMVLTLIWGLCLKRIGGWLSSWNEDLERLEKSAHADIRVFGGVRYTKEWNKYRMAVADIMGGMIGLFGVAWVLTLVYFWFRFVN